jgi:hypothetical protein
MRLVVIRGTIKTEGHTELTGACQILPEEEVPLHRSALPKLSFPKFSGTNPKIWIDKCIDYFKIFNILDHMWTTVTSLHMEDNATKWLQVYKMK